MASSQNKTSPFSVSPTGPSTKVSPGQSSQGDRSGMTFDGGSQMPGVGPGPGTLVTGLLPPLLTLRLPPQACDSQMIFPLFFCNDNFLQNWLKAK